MSRSDGVAVEVAFKAKEGARDFYMNTLGDVDLPIVAGMATKDVVNANCKACHFATNENVASMDAKPYCVDCHRSAQHMRMKPISTRWWPMNSRVFYTLIRLAVVCAAWDLPRAATTCPQPN